MAMTLLADAWNDALRIIIACSALILAVIVLGIGLLWARKHLLARQETASDSGELFTLDQLRQMRSEGLLSEMEFQTMKAAVIEAMTENGARSSRGDTSFSPPILMEPDQTAPDSDQNKDWDWVNPDFDLKNRPER